MQNKEKIKFLLWIVLGVSFCLIHITWMKEKRTNALWKEKFLLEKTNIQTFHKVLKRNMNSIIYTDGTPINAKHYIYKIYNNQKDSISYTTLKRTLTLFVPQKSCNICYDEIYDALKFAKDSLSLDCLIITEKEKYNEVRNIIMDLGINNKNTYYLVDTTFWNSIDIAYAPFLSYIDDNLKCTHSFVPFPNHPQYSYHYLDILKSKYFNLVR